MPVAGAPKYKGVKAPDAASQANHANKDHHYNLYFKSSGHGVH